MSPVRWNEINWFGEFYFGYDNIANGGTKQHNIGTLL